MSSMQAGHSLLTDEPPYLTSMEKWKIFADWNEFVGSGFQFAKFSVELYQVLVQYCGFIKGYPNLVAFWTYYFDSEVDRLRLFMHQFATGVGAETGTPTWLNLPFQDLKDLMRQRLGVVYTALLQTLDDIDYAHEKLVGAWTTFAAHNGLSLTNIAAPRCQVSSNTRALLAVSDRIASLYNQQQLHQASQQDSMVPGYYQQLVSPMTQPAGGSSSGLKLVPVR